MPTTSRSRAAATSEIRRRLARLTPPPPASLGPEAEPSGPDADADDGVGAHVDVLPEVPSPPRPARFDPGRPGLLLLCAVAVIAAGLSAWLTWAGRPDSVPVPAAVLSAVDVPTPIAAPSTGPSAVASPTSVVVAVVGQVVTPGLVTLPLGSRVADAVAAAGGARPDADLSTVNLARVLVDGEQVAVGVPGAPPADGPSAATPDVPALLNLNTATESELEELPGVGPVLAGRITAYREDQGGFTSVDELQEVSGIGPSTFADLQDAVTV